MVTLASLIEKVKKDVDPAKVGMIVCHNGVVRGTSRAGLSVELLEIDVDQSAWDQVMREMRCEPGIAAIEAYLFAGVRRVGDDVMFVVVAGDIRENVFPVLERTVNRLKAEAVLKKEKIRG
jgi:molybdopterin synthase catalytic subunit